MTSTGGGEAEEERMEVLNGPSPSTESPDSDGVTVVVTSCELKEPVSKSDSLPPLLKKAAYINPFSGRRGLSSVSLDVLTSGEHLNELSLEDLRYMGGGQQEGSSQGSIPDCQSLEDEVKWEDCHIAGRRVVRVVEEEGGLKDVVDGEGDEGRGGKGSEEEEGEGMVEDARSTGSGQDAMEQVGCPDAQQECPNKQEECPNDEQERRSNHRGGIQPNKREQEGCPDWQDGYPDELGRPLNSPRTVVEVTPTCQTPSDDSRCSSSMGYLEPRPPNQSPPEGDSMPSPKDIQRHLMERVNNLGPDCNEEVEGAEQVVQGAELEVPSKIRSSRSSQSLNSSGGNNGSKSISFGSIFSRRRSLAARSRDHNPETMAATSTTGLILHDRPKTLPAKSAAEENRHQRLHQQMMAAARKKELQKAKQEVKKEKRRRERDKLVADSLVEWEKILLKWESLHNTRKVRELWWQGLPPGVRGNVWKKALGNELHISSDLYVINLRRCKERLALARDRSDSSTSRSSVSREQSVEVIHLDVLRTFPTLGFFQEGGPYNQSLCDVLGAYACYRPDIGYVQGMSFLAGVLLLNMDAGDAFISLANLLNRPSYLAFFKVDHTLMQPYFSTFAALLHDNLPKLSIHFSKLQFSPEYYLIEWIFTIYTRVLPLDVACRVWDMFCRDGDSFLFRTALGILKQFQSSLLELRSIEDMGQFLGHFPNSLDSDALFSQIDSIHTTPKRFKQILAQQHSKLKASDSTTR